MNKKLKKLIEDNKEKLEEEIKTLSYAVCYLVKRVEDLVSIYEENNEQNNL